MIDVEKLAALLADNVSMADAAKAFGVSRQRIHQIIKRHKLKHTLYIRQPESAKPRLLTNGLRLGTMAAGKVSEMMVAADLLARGWQVFFPIYQSIHGYDLIAVKADRIIKVEVKSAYRNQSKIQYAKKRHPIDYYALVLFGEPVQYESPDGRPEQP
jgi:PD-(D/E)XK endonuclease